MSPFEVFPFHTASDLPSLGPVQALMNRVRLVREGERVAFPDLLARVPAGQPVSAWSGPALAQDSQPTVVAFGVALAIVAKDSGDLVALNPDFGDLSDLLKAHPRPEDPGQVTNQPHMKRAGAAWLRLLSAFEDAAGARDFRSDTGLRPPLGLMSFGFAPATPGVLLLPKVTWVSAGDATWRIEVGEQYVPEQAQPAAGAEAAGKAQPAAAAEGAEQAEPTENAGQAEPTGNAGQAGPTGKAGQAATSWYLDPGTMSRGAWKHAVEAVIENLRKGDTQKAVMARDITARANGLIDVPAMLTELASAYPTCWKFSVAGMTGASPEMLASVRGGVVKSRVLAGTCAPGQGEALWNSAKDRQEHAFAVQSVVDALQPMTSALDAPEEPFLLDLPNVTHLATDVQAKLAGANADGLAPVCEVVRALHPTAAVCGTPTQAAFELLSIYELTDRGRYSGPVGWIDGAGEGACAIALRCGQVLPDGKSIRVFAGGGIMPDSRPDVEVRETQAKMMPVLQALGLEK